MSWKKSVKMPVSSKDIIIIALVGVLIYLLFQNNSKSNFIEERKYKFERFQDRLNKAIDSLLKEFDIKDPNIAEISLKNDSLKARIARLDRSINKLLINLDNEVDIIDNSTTDETIELLSKYLSKEGTD